MDPYMIPEPAPEPQPVADAEAFTKHATCAHDIGLIRQAYAAGRARGIEEMSTKAATVINDLIEGRASNVALALLEARNSLLAIADAIAKETDRG